MKKNIKLKDLFFIDKLFIFLILLLIFMLFMPYNFENKVLFIFDTLSLIGWRLIVFVMDDENRKKVGKINFFLSIFLSIILTIYAILLKRGLLIIFSIMVLSILLIKMVIIIYKKIK